MGRPVYTPSTLIHLYNQAGVAPPLLDRSASPARSASPSEADELDADGNKPMSVLDFQASYSVAAQYAAAKDAPLPWRVSAFDPNDDELPVVTERFIDPAEMLPCPHYLDSLQNSQQERGDESETVIDEDDFDEDAYEENEEEEEEDEDLEEGDEVDERSMYELEEDGLEVEEAGRAEYLRAVESVHHDLAAPAPRLPQAFSPSMGVFHAHTLPLVLPSRGEIQLMHQERRSSNGSSTSRMNA